MLLDDNRVRGGRASPEMAGKPAAAELAQQPKGDAIQNAATKHAATDVRGADFTLLPTNEINASLDYRRDKSTNYLVLLFGSLTLFLVIGLWFGSFSKQESMRGSVIAASGSTRVSTNFAGIVAKIWVSQGEAVVKGQKIITLQPEQAVSDGTRTLESRLAGLMAQRENMVRDMDRYNSILKNEAGDRRMMDDDSVKLVKTLRTQESELEKVLAAQEISLRKIQGFHDRGYATRDQLTSETRVALDYRRQLADLRFRISELNTSLIERRRGLDQNAAQTTNSRSELANRIHDIDAAIQNLKVEGSVDIVAPADGIVSALAVRNGDSVTQRQFVVALAAPNSAIRITLEAPSKAVGLLSVGKRVVLKYDAFPYKTFGVQYGTVVAVSETALDIPQRLDTSSGTSNPLRPPQSTYLVEVQPEKTHIEAYGESRPILIGSTLTADIVVERRRLIDWVLDPVLAMKGRL